MELYASLEAALRHLSEGQRVYKVTNPYRAPLYIPSFTALEAIMAACRVWNIAAQPAAKLIRK
jgi:hypothetical protein